MDDCFIWSWLIGKIRWVHVRWGGEKISWNLPSEDFTTLLFLHINKHWRNVFIFLFNAYCGFVIILVYLTSNSRSFHVRKYALKVNVVQSAHLTYSANNKLFSKLRGLYKSKFICHCFTYCETFCSVIIHIYTPIRLERSNSSKQWHTKQKTNIELSFPSACKLTLNNYFLIS